MKSYNDLVKQMDDIIQSSAVKGNQSFDLDWEQICPGDKYNLVALAMLDDGKELLGISENDKYEDIQICYVNFYKTYDRQYLDDAAMLIADYYTPRLKKVLEDRLKACHQDAMSAAGFRATIDPDSGTTEWR